jgi:hypothetical protein
MEDKDASIRAQEALNDKNILDDGSSRIMVYFSKLE